MKGSGVRVPASAPQKFADRQPFDEANLVPSLLRWLPEPLELRTRVADRDGHVVAVIFVGRHPSGCAFFRADGQYVRSGREVVAFRAGDVFWRDGTRTRTPKRPCGCDPGVVTADRRSRSSQRCWRRAGARVETNQLVMAVGGGDARGGDERSG
jgi:hypothetical protein